MTLNINLEDVPDAILEAVKARIMANRRRLEEENQQQENRSLKQPAMIRRQAPDELSWKRPQTAVPSGSSGWLLVPSGPWQESLQGFRCVVGKLPNVPLETTEGSFDYVNQTLVPADEVDEFGNRVIDANALYETEASRPNGALTGLQLNRFTFEGFIDPGNPGLLFSDRKGREIRARWYWRYTTETTSRDQFGNVFFRQTSVRFYFGIDGQPGPPSVELGPWPKVEEEFDTRTVFLSETRIDTQAAGYEPSPIYESRFYIACVLYKADNLNAAYLDAVAEVKYRVQEGASREASIVLGVETNSETTPQEIIEESVTVNSSTGRQHFAFAFNDGTMLGFLGGTQVMEVQVPSDLIQPEWKYGFSVFIYANAYDLDSERVEPPGNVLEAGFGADTYGKLRMVDASKHALSGIRFTPGRALYRGPSFTPPTSITRLA